MKITINIKEMNDRDVTWRHHFWIRKGIFFYNLILYASMSFMLTGLSFLFYYLSSLLSVTWWLSSLSVSLTTLCVRCSRESHHITLFSMLFPFPIYHFILVPQPPQRSGGGMIAWKEKGDRRKIKSFSLIAFMSLSFHLSLSLSRLLVSSSFCSIWVFLVE